jgi:hypothetical protein
MPAVALEPAGVAATPLPAELPAALGGKAALPPPLPAAAGNGVGFPLPFPAVPNVAGSSGLGGLEQPSMSNANHGQTLCWSLRCIGSSKL